MGEVVNGPFETTGEIPPDRILQAAVGVLQDVVVIGRKADGGIYLASSSGDMGLIAYLMLQAQHELVLLGERE